MPESTLDGPQGAYPGPYMAGHEPARFDLLRCVACRRPWPCPVEDARRTILALLKGRDEDADGNHIYLSTSCLHGEHAYCQATTAEADAVIPRLFGDQLVVIDRLKAPAACKFCRAPCICRCHEEGS